MLFVRKLKLKRSRFLSFVLYSLFVVEIHLGIRDNLGAKTAVCKLPVRVVAKQLGSQNETEEEYL